MADLNDQMLLPINNQWSQLRKAKQDALARKAAGTATPEDMARYFTPKPLTPIQGGAGAFVRDEEEMMKRMNSPFGIKSGPSNVDSGVWKYANDPSQTNPMDVVMEGGTVPSGFTPKNTYGNLNEFSLTGDQIKQLSGTPGVGYLRSPMTPTQNSFLSGAGNLIGNIGSAAGSLIGGVGGGLLNGAGSLLNGIGGLFGGGSQPSQPSSGFNLNNILGSLGGLITPNNIIGGGLLAGGIASDKEPGEVTQARQFLRNRFTSPNALSDQFAGQINGLKAQFQPLLDQQRNRDINDISQRFAAAFPSTVGAQGPEFGTLSRYITDEALPREQGLMGDLGLKLLDYQGNAAGKILDTSKPDPMAQLASMLGYDLLTRGQGGGQGGGIGGLFGGQGAGTTGGIGQAGSLPIGALGQLSPAQLAQQLLTPGNMGQIGQYILQAGGINSPMAQAIARALGSTLSIDMSQAGAGLSGVMVQTSHGVSVPIEAINAQGLAGAPGGAAGASTGFQGLLGAPGFGSAAGIASGAATLAGSGYLGYKVGSALGDALESPGSSATGLKTGAAGGAGGAAAGAALGAAIGDGPGAIIGAIAGGLAGIFGGSGAERRREDAQTAQETAYTDSRRPQVINDANQLGQAAVQATADFQSVTSNPQFRERLAQLAQARNPAIVQILNEAMQNPTLRAENMNLDNGTGVLLNYIDSVSKAAVSRVGPNAPLKNPDGSPTQYGQLQSKEVGWFDPGVAELKKLADQFTQAQVWYQKLKSLL